MTQASCDDTHTPIRDKDWRELSAAISPGIVAGFDVEGISGLSKQQQRLMKLPKDFRIHKMHHNLGIITTATALALYGELDRAVAGLSPLQEVPIWDYNIPDYDYTLYAIRSVCYFVQCAGREDLEAKIRPLMDVPSFYNPLPVTLSGKMLSSHLDIPQDELAQMSHITPAMWVERYVKGVAGLARAYVLGGSVEYPFDRLRYEMNRYAVKIFTTPGYEPFNCHSYPVQ